MQNKGDENKAIAHWTKGVEQSLNKLSPAAELDELVLSNSKRRAKPITKLIVVAAILLLSVYLFNLFSHQQPKPQYQSLSKLKKDINGDNEVNMVDAFLLQKKIDAGEEVELDLNDDGLTNSLDVEILAESSIEVSLL